MPAASSWTGAILPARVYLCIFLAVGCLIALAGWREWAGREAKLQEVAVVGSNLARSLVQQAEDTIKVADTALTGMVDLLEAPGGTSPEALVRLNRLLATWVAETPVLQGLLVYGDDGRWLANWLGRTPEGATNADREYFRHHQASPDRGPFIGPALVSRTTGRPMFTVSRRFNRPDGSFAGVVLATIDLDRLTRHYASFDVGRGGAIALLRLDGRVLAHSRFEPRLLDLDLSGNSLFRERLPRSSAGQSQYMSPTDGVERLGSYNRSSVYPVVTMASLALNEVLAPWRAAAILRMIGVVVVLCVLGALALRLAGQISRRQAVERALAESEDHYRHAVQLNPAMPWTAAPDGAITEVSGRWLALIGRTRGEIVGHGWVRVLHPEDRDAAVELWLRSLRSGEPYDAEFRVALADKAYRWFRARAAARRDAAGGILRWYGTLEDIHDSKLAEARIVHMAHHDALTNLPNRVLLRERMDEALARTEGGNGFAVLCLDLDRFKEINDTLGHRAGDALLCEVARRLQDELRPTDLLARLGGDEFAIIQAPSDHPAERAALAQRLIECFAAPFDLEVGRVIIGTSIGIARASIDGTDSDTLLRAADLALYRAKEQGRGGWCFFEPGMEARLQARRALEMDLRRAVAMEEFEVHYQPVVDITSGEVTGFEALLRWRHPLRGMVPPTEFIPLAEETGLIVPLGAWVLQRACADAVTWPGALKVAVNLSAVQFGGQGPVRAVAAALAASRLAPARLKLEITETVMLADTDATLATLGELKALGVSIALDDFGTGYSSLSYLRKFPFDRVKIDRSFVRDLGTCAESLAIVRAITDLCRTLGMSTTAEGVETVEQLESLRATQCAQVQGYLFSRPRPAAEVPAMLASTADLRISVPR